MCCHCLPPDEVFNECSELGVEDGWRGGAGACCFAAVILETSWLFSNDGAVHTSFVHFRLNTCEGAINIKCSSLTGYRQSI